MLFGYAMLWAGLDTTLAFKGPLALLGIKDHKVHAKKVIYPPSCNLYDFFKT